MTIGGFYKFPPITKTKETKNGYGQIYKMGGLLGQCHIDNR